MSTDQTLAPGAEPNISMEPYSADWWHARSTEELREFINRGVQGGPAFDGATVETERRARARQHEVQQTVDAQAIRNKRFRLLTLETVLLACLVILIAVLLLR